MLAVVVAHDRPEGVGSLLGGTKVASSPAGDTHSPSTDGGRRVGRGLVGKGGVVEACGGAGEIEASGTAGKDVGWRGVGLRVVEFGR